MSLAGGCGWGGGGVSLAGGSEGGRAGPGPAAGRGPSGLGMIYGPPGSRNVLRSEGQHITIHTPDNPRPTTGPDPALGSGTGAGTPW